MFERALESSGPQDMWFMLLFMLFVVSLVVLILVIVFIMVGFIRDRKWKAVWTLAVVSAAFLGPICAAVWSTF